MKSLAEKLATLLPKLAEHGPIYLFALFEQDDVPGKWDVMFSSDWSDRNKSSAIRTIADALVPLLEREELVALSRVVIIPSREPSIAQLASGMSIQGGCVELANCNFMGIQVGHAFIFQALRPSVTLPSATTA